MRKIIVSLVVLVALGIFAMAELQRRWEEPLSISEEGFVLAIEQGDSLKTIVDKLYHDDVLKYPTLVILYGRWTGLDQQIKKGEYLLPPNLTAESLLTYLQNGDVIQYQVTLPEGITLETALGILAQQDKLEIVISGLDDPRLHELVMPYTSPEGLFFPDSYKFVRGDTDWSILQRAHTAMKKILHEEWDQRASDLPYNTPYEALIMASIIERETGLRAERSQISGVFARRLQKGMLLQTDPTVIYGLGEEFDGNLQRQHLAQEDNAYNTYRHSGLPPTPISLPGREAIRSALHPEPGSALYFVARGDGGHAFSDTLKEHNQAVRAYQLQRNKDYRSTPGKQQ